ncbi:hypothetical protein ACFQMH_20140 [Streptomyces viridiviolaceus]|uniref:Uncharacterized protein n=1 Tax=Streptomyces viridiviolaceus TaxID=68282 RepID=A0ABW2E5A8_9ACTN|nr:hypothetical protein [Streptomyces viridiviolaceus]
MAETRQRSTAGSPREARRQVADSALGHLPLVVLVCAARADRVRR